MLSEKFKRYNLTLKENNIDIAVLTIPKDAAVETAEMLVNSGIKAIWNFTPYRIRVRDGIVMTNTSIYAHLALIYNRLEAI